MNDTNGNIRVGHLFGIPFFINPSWFLILGLVTFSYGSNLSLSFPTLGGALPWILGLVAALLLFASVLVHELGHSLVALRQGINVRSITLFLFGGVASLDKESSTPAQSFWVAIAGPLVSLTLFGILVSLEVSLPVESPLTAVVGLLATINLILAVFNLLPGLPLDGGNILKSIVWKITGNPYRGVIIAGRSGQVLGGLGILTGVVPLVLAGSFANIWNLLIGWFLLRNASLSVRNGQLQNQLSQLTVSDALSEGGPVISSALNLREFANQFVIGQGQWQRFWVVNEEGVFLGVLQVEDLKTIPTDLWPQTPVTELVQTYTGPDPISPQLSLLEVANLLEQEHSDGVPVVDENHLFRGWLGKKGIRQALQGRV
ncbi:MAG: site-2 protease family protein [Synechococcaceae cyanobacterium SM2_3_1]|nr:site-2 protease family protein [Synechococcaceae cyanobacterium SM2_3_1]